MGDKGFSVSASQGLSPDVSFLLCMQLHAYDVCVDTVSQLYVGVSSETLLKFIRSMLQAIP